MPEPPCEAPDSRPHAPVIVPPPEEERYYGRETLFPAALALRLSEATTILTAAITEASAVERCSLECLLEQALSYAVRPPRANAIADLEHDQPPRHTAVGRYNPGLANKLEGLQSASPTPEQIADVLLYIWDDDESTLWRWLLLSDPPGLDGLSPIQAMRAGRVSDVVALLAQVAAGITPKS